MQYPIDFDRQLPPSAGQAVGWLVGTLGHWNLTAFANAAVTLIILERLFDLEDIIMI
jgi:hypothetical protein